MNKLWNKVRKSILFYSCIHILILILLYFTLDKYNLVFLKWFEVLNIVAISLEIMTGIIQLIVKSYKRRQNAIILSIMIMGFTILCIILIIANLIYLVVRDEEKLVDRDNRKMIKETHSVLYSNWVNYYDFENIFVRKKQVRIYEAHNNYIAEEPISTDYYDENGRLVKTDDPYFRGTEIYVEKKKETVVAEKEENKDTKDSSYENRKILYEKKIDEKTKIRVVVKDYILAQRSLIGIQKTTDRGATWIEQLETSDKVITIHNGAKFVFLNENLGFINDLGLVDTAGDNRGLLVTIDGGKNFEQVIIKSEKLNENLYIEDVPYIQNNVLKVKAYILRNLHEENIELYSKDGGITWEEII